MTKCGRIPKRLFLCFYILVLGVGSGRTSVDEVVRRGSETVGF